MSRHQQFMHMALRLARRGFGRVSPNPTVGALLVRRGEIIGQGWHRRAGGPHAEIEAIRDAEARGHHVRGADLYVTLEPCSTHGRTPPCTNAIVEAGIRRVWVAATDPNPRHRGRGLRLLERAGITVVSGIEADRAAALNEAFNHWIVHRTPWVTVKAAMTMDGRIATAQGESKWITSEPSRRFAMQLRRAADAIVVGVNTVIVDNPRLNVRDAAGREAKKQPVCVVLDPSARIPLFAAVLTGVRAYRTIVVTMDGAPAKRVAALREKAEVWRAPQDDGRIDLRWLLRRLGGRDITSVLVEGGGETNARFLLGGHAHRVAFFYAPKILGGRDARHGVAGDGVASLSEAVPLQEIRWRRIGPDLLLQARCSG